MVRAKRAGILAVLALVLLGVPAGVVRAQSPTDDPPTAVGGPLLVFTGARLDGDGPWTSYLGAGADRELVVTVGNVGDRPSPSTTLALTLDRGAELRADESELTLAPLAPGESATLRLDVRLRALALGTYGVEGSVPGITATAFRAETTHVPWVLVAIPLLVLVQLTLVAVRNRVRRRLHPEEPVAPAPPSITADADAEPAVDELATVVGEELAAVFGHGVDTRAILTDTERAELVIDLTEEVADRVADRVRLTGPERAALGAELAEVMVATHAPPPEPDPEPAPPGTDPTVDHRGAATP